MSRSPYRVRVEKDYLVFAAGHFITYGQFCEALHGHNYRASVELEGELDENAYVFDFVPLKRTLRRLVNELDHKMLLPLENPRLEVREVDEEVHVSFRDQAKRYVFPKEDVVLLGVSNTTAEMLAYHLMQRLKEEIGVDRLPNLRAIEVHVEEVFGQTASHREELPR